MLGAAEAELSAAAREKMKASRAAIEKLIGAGKAVYGVNTGFGKMAATRISADEIRHLQLNLVRSHACGVGVPLSEPATRAILALRANAIAKGFSGVRPIVAETLIAMLNRRVHPVIPSQGSAGASAILRRSRILRRWRSAKGKRCSGPNDAGRRCAACRGNCSPCARSKRGSSSAQWHASDARALDARVAQAEIAADTADVATALSLDALRGSPSAFDPRVMRARPHAGATVTARNIERLNRGSEIRESHRSPDVDPRVQDPYSLRCAPQVHGAVRDSLAQVRAMVTIEINSATDNPLVFAETDDVVSGGNFHGQPLAMAADQMAVAVATLGGISERRIEQMTNPQTSMLPAFLVREAGLNSGFMILQVTAAALASGSRALAAPHSIGLIPTSANQEDYVSMGMGAARRLAPMLANLRNILAIELLAACQGIDFLAPLRPGVEARKAYHIVRSLSKRVDSDRSLAPDIEAVSAAVETGKFSDLIR